MPDINNPGSWPEPIFLGLTTIFSSVLHDPEKNIFWGKFEALESARNARLPLFFWWVYYIHEANLITVLAFLLWVIWGLQNVFMKKRHYLWLWIIDKKKKVNDVLAHGQFLIGVHDQSPKYSSKDRCKDWKIVFNVHALRGIQQSGFSSNLRQRISKIRWNLLGRRY